MSARPNKHIITINGYYQNIDKTDDNNSTKASIPLTDVINLYHQKKSKRSSTVITNEINLMDWSSITLKSIDDEDFKTLYTLPIELSWFGINDYGSLQYNNSDKTVLLVNQQQESYPHPTWTLQYMNNDQKVVNHVAPCGGKYFNVQPGGSLSTPFNYFPPLVNNIFSGWGSNFYNTPNPKDTKIEFEPKTLITSQNPLALTDNDIPQINFSPDTVTGNKITIDINTDNSATITFNLQVNNLAQYCEVDDNKIKNSNKVFRFRLVLFRSATNLTWDDWQTPKKLALADTFEFDFDLGEHINSNGVDSVSISLKNDSYEIFPAGWYPDTAFVGEDPKTSQKFSYGPEDSEYKQFQNKGPVDLLNYLKTKSGDIYASVVATRSYMITALNTSLSVVPDTLSTCAKMFEGGVIVTDNNIANIYTSANPVNTWTSSGLGGTACRATCNKLIPAFNAIWTSNDPERKHCMISVNNINYDNGNGCNGNVPHTNLDGWMIGDSTPYYPAKEGSPYCTDAPCKKNTWSLGNGNAGVACTCSYIETRRGIYTPATWTFTKESCELAVEPLLATDIVKVNFS